MATLNITVNLPAASAIDLDDLQRRVTNYANKLVAEYSVPQQKEEANTDGVYISGRIKALETGFKSDLHLSEDYKKEIRELRSGRYL